MSDCIGLLGHRSLRMTQVYARIRDAELRKDLERAARKRKTVNYQGQAVKSDLHANDPDAQMFRKGIRGQTLPVGGCFSLVVCGDKRATSRTSKGSTENGYKPHHKK